MESKPSAEKIDMASSPTFPKDEIRDGLNNFKNLQKITTNMDAINVIQFDPSKKPATGNARSFVRALGDKQNVVTSNLDPSAQYYAGNYLKGSNPLKINS